MQIKLWHRFYFKTFLAFWIFGAIILMCVSFIAGNLTVKSWMSPREKLFINAYASIIIKSLDSVSDKKKYLCDLNKSLNNQFVVISEKSILSCHKLKEQFETVKKNNLNNAYVYKNWIVSDSIIVNGERFWLSSIRNKPLYNTLIKKNVAYRLLTAVIFSAIICFFLVLYLTRPLKIVIKKMSDFSGGNLNARVGNALKNRKDEFTEIGYAYDNMAKNIQDLIRAKQHMLYNISHELRSPLARQLLTLDVLKITPRKNQKKLLDIVEKENITLNKLISEILLLAKLSTRTFSYNPKKSDICQLIKNAVDNVNYEYKTNVIRFNSNFKLILMVDDKLMMMVLENLLKNAIKYSGIEKEIDVSIKKEDKIVAITITDRGPGIEKDELPLIFEPFKQSKNKNKINDTDNGYGLGLAIAKEIITLHKGDIFAHNNSPRGLSITIHLSSIP